MAKVFIEETTLTAIGDAIRGKTGKTALIDPANMSTEITNIPAGGGDDFHIVLSGNCSNACYGKVATIILEERPSMISTENITNAEGMFKETTLKTIPISLNFASGAASLNNMFGSAPNLESVQDLDVKHTNYASFTAAFYNCRNLKTLPKIYNAYPSSIQNFAYSCYMLSNVPDDYFTDWNFDRLLTSSSSQISSVFASCYSLRKFPTSWFEKIKGTKATSSSYSLYASMAYSCTCLDELVNVPVLSGTLTNNCFNSALTNASRLKRFVFETSEDGTPKTANWKSQTMDFSSSVGYCPSYNANCITDYASGITSATKVTNDANYQELKNDPDWWTLDVSYSRYNHDSAVETINSLPDTSAYLATSGGTNTIKFKGTSGSATDGGAINTLTAEEIAVATAKGWTVTLV